MTAQSQTVENGNCLATHADYANANFEAIEKPEDVSKFGSEILADRCVDFRIAAVTLSRSKKDLIGNFFQETPEEQEKIKEMWMTTIERLIDTEKFIKRLAEMNDLAVTRLLSVMATIQPEDQETPLAAE